MSESEGIKADVEPRRDGTLVFRQVGRGARRRDAGRERRRAGRTSRGVRGRVAGCRGGGRVRTCVRAKKASLGCRSCIVVGWVLETTLLCLAPQVHPTKGRAPPKSASPSPIPKSRALLIGGPYSSSSCRGDSHTRRRVEGEHRPKFPDVREECDGPAPRARAEKTPGTVRRRFAEWPTTIAHPVPEGELARPHPAHSGAKRARRGCLSTQLPLARSAVPPPSCSAPFRLTGLKPAQQQQQARERGGRPRAPGRWLWPQLRARALLALAPRPTPRLCSFPFTT